MFGEPIRRMVRTVSDVFWGRRPHGRSHSGAVLRPAHLPAAPPAAVTVWVRDAADGGPLANAEYEIVRATTGAVVATGRTSSLEPVAVQVGEEGRYLIRVLSVDDPRRRSERGTPYLVTAEVVAHPAGRAGKPHDVLVALKSAAPAGPSAQGGSPP